MTAEVIQFPWRWNSGTNTLNSGVIYKKRLGEISNGSKDEEEGTFEEERAGPALAHEAAVEVGEDDEDRVDLARFDSIPQVVEGQHSLDGERRHRGQCTHPFRATASWWGPP